MREKKVNMEGKRKLQEGEKVNQDPGDNEIKNRLDETNRYAPVAYATDTNPGCRWVFNAFSAIVRRP